MSEQREQTVTKTKAPLSPLALRLAREDKQLSQRELGRRVADRLGRAEAARAIQVRLSRLEHGDEISQTDRELLDALAAELAVGVEDLAEPFVWIWIKLHNGRPGIVELAMRMVCYTTADLAYQARDLLAHASQGQFLPFKEAQLVPMRSRTLNQDVLDENYPDLNERERRLLVAVDPDEDSLPYLAALNEVLNDDDPEKWKMEAIVDTLSKFGLVGEIVQLHDLALRRVMLVPKDDDLLRAWVRREHRLNEILERYHEMRREWREQTLANVLPPR